ncbi:aspartyl-phosphate phosphatase Spo0E family protein [Desulfosporosinus fructosivorans]|uniref:Aspartyl-phosphate phosphatase Spo0E family protein n=1 Tax=Desulfosporosinus fructosivorans TaxID=2018669 RepID=A0A4Z0RC24_9FIRM|nr:aspartyl-phosphate phosphatase Spo0E family protein [Desulfosporosinus fructosivorans]TGE39789.1 aspartyl-phosphate phosphatase Spo0E family protein [Desulfosporosinus fructosivorans]
MKQLTTDEKIEELRLLMQAVASDKDLTDHRVVSLSTKLDLLINEFYKNNIGFSHPAV